MGNGDRSDGFGNEGGGDCNGDNTRDGKGNDGWRATKRAMARAARAMTMSTKRAMAMAAKVMVTVMKRAMVMVGESNVNDGKSNGQQQRRGQGQGQGQEEVW
jgi:hypothetical protein